MHTVLIIFVLNSKLILLTAIYSNKNGFCGWKALRVANAVSALPFTSESEVKRLVGQVYSWMGDHLGIASC